MKTITFLVALAVAGLGVCAGLIYSGHYNIGADRPHWPITLKLMEFQREQSIAAHAKGIAVPALDDPALIAEGAEHYAPMCSGCHLAPGMENTELRSGLYPQPRNLAEAGDGVAQGDADRAAVRRFWIIKHGIKMSGMPAWGTTHDDESIWAIVAFLRKLPGLSAAQYQALTGAGNRRSHGDGGHDHSAHHAEPEPSAADEAGHAHEHDEAAELHDAATDSHHHGPAEGHAHGEEETEQPHSH